MKRNFNLKQYIIITLITSIWIHISEVFRYFVLVIPKMKLFFENKEGIAEMDLGIFAIWGLWDTLLTAIVVFVYFLYTNTFGNNLRSVFMSSKIVWLSVFVIFWVATANMGLSDWNILSTTLSLSWLEMCLGTWISHRLYTKGWLIN